MPLSNDEVVELSDLALELVERARAASALTGPGGKRVTRAEAVELLKAASALAATLTLELLD